MTKAPNYRIILCLPAIDPSLVEIAWLELHANSPREAHDLAECYIRSNTEIISVIPIPLVEVTP